MCYLFFHSFQENVEETAAPEYPEKGEIENVNKNETDRSQKEESKNSKEKQVGKYFFSFLLQAALRGPKRTLLLFFAWQHLLKRFRMEKNGSKLIFF